MYDGKKDALGDDTRVFLCTVYFDLKCPFGAFTEKEEDAYMFEGCLDPCFFLMNDYQYYGGREKSWTYLKFTQSCFSCYFSRFDLTPKAVVSLKLLS